MVYDKAKYHYGGEGFPADFPPERGGTHIGFFLAWAIHRGLASDELLVWIPDKLDAVRSRSLTGRDLIFSVLDEAVSDYELNPEGHLFAQEYYDSTNQYLADYNAAFCDDYDNIYAVEDTWANFDRIAVVVDQRFVAWRSATGTTGAG